MRIEWTRVYINTDADSLMYDDENEMQSLCKQLNTMDTVRPKTLVIIC